MKLTAIKFKAAYCGACPRVVWLHKSLKLPSTEMKKELSTVVFFVTGDKILVPPSALSKYCINKEITNKKMQTKK